MEALSISDAVRKVAKLSLPNILSFLVMICSTQATIQCFSKAGNDVAVAGVGLGGFIFSMFGLAIGLGLSSALDTVVSQAMGTGDLKTASINLAQARLVTLIAAVPCGLILWMTESILVLIKQDAEQARLAGVFINWQLIGLVPLFWQCALGCFMRACNKTKSPLIANVCGTTVHVVASVIFNYMLDYGVETAGIIAAVGNTVRLVVLEAYILGYLTEEERNICSLPAFIRTVLNRRHFRELCAGITTFVALAIPSSIMM